ncbi:hypothetical protein BGZ75_007061 [Mortierella antarctica]|nr:hypothetical protein BGZ75_007061 [Mortierella antarctica]
MIRHSRILTTLLKLPENKKCFDCPSKVNVYANLFNNTFICEKCSGLHRELNHRVKSISASTFTPEEISGLQKGGNAVAKRIWLATWSWREYPEPDAHEVDEVRQFMRAKYVKKQWYQDPEGSGNGVTSTGAPISQRSTTTSTISPAVNGQGGALAIPDRVRAISKSQSIENLYLAGNSSNNNGSSASSGTTSTLPERTLSRKSSTISSDSGSTTFSKSTDPSSAGSSPFTPAGAKQQHLQQSPSHLHQTQQYQTQGSFDSFMGSVTSSGSATPGHVSVLGGHTFAGTPAAIESADPFSVMNNAFGRMGVDSASQFSNGSNGAFTHGASANMSVAASTPTSSDFFTTFSLGSSMGHVPAHTQSHTSVAESNDPFSLSSAHSVHQSHQQQSPVSQDYNATRGSPLPPTSVSGNPSGAKSFDDYLSAFGQGQQPSQQFQGQHQASFSSSAMTTSSPSSLSPTPAFSAASLSPQSTGGASNPFGMQQSPHQPPLQRAYTADYPSATNTGSGHQSNPFAMFAKQPNNPLSNAQPALSGPFGHAGRALQQQQQLQSQDYFSNPGLGSQNSLSPNPFMSATSPNLQPAFSQQQQQQQQQQYQRQQPAFFRSASESSHGFQQNAFFNNTAHNNMPSSTGSMYESAFSVPGSTSRSMTVPAPAAGQPSNMNDMFGQWMKPSPATASSKYPSIDDLDPFSTSTSSATAYSNPFSL